MCLKSVALEVGHDTRTIVSGISRMLVVKYQGP